MQIKVRITTNYGQTAVYPVCKDAETFASIAGTRTLTARTIKLITSLGYWIDVEPQTLEV